MNDDVIADLKQFIATTVSQEISDVREDVRSLRTEMQDIRAELRTEMQDMEHRLTTRIDDLQQSIAESLDAANESTDTQLQDHEQRISLLEQKAAA